MLAWQCTFAYSAGAAVGVFYVVGLAESVGMGPTERSGQAVSAIQIGTSYHTM